MPLNPNIPTKEVRELCACPVDWTSIPGFGHDCPDALELLLCEWVRTVAREAISSEELKLIENVLFDPENYDPPHPHTLENLASRRPAAERVYRAEIGRLGRLRFLRPSEHKKHYSVSGPRKSANLISHFYTDWQASTLANLFWSWFDDMMELEGVPLRDGKIHFRRDVGPLWDALRFDRQKRIAIDTGAMIGEQSGVPFRHLAIDIDFFATVAHAYPVSEVQAAAIMDPYEVLLVKSREY